MQRKVAVIDIGSNTIKLLVAEKSDGADQLHFIFRNTLETRIGQGISTDKPILSPEAITRACEAVGSLINDARSFEPVTIRIVATSAVRDAGNRETFARAIEEQCGFPLEILSGRREGELIGTAIQLDPQISARDFYAFDLGGGSLECLRFCNRQLEQVESLPLGCVRLAEKLLADPAAPFTTDDQQRIADKINRVIEESGFRFSLPTEAISVGTGGTLTTALNIAAARQGKDLADMPPYLSLAELRELLSLAGGRPLKERLQIPRLSAGRADVFPTALTTFITLAELTGQELFHHSFFNLRYGLAAETLGSQTQPPK